MHAQYQSFLGKLPSEPVSSAIYVAVYLLPLIAIASQGISWIQVALSFGFLCCVHSLEFVITHATVHAIMALQDGSPRFGFAFWHHFHDRTLYSKVPYAYRCSMNTFMIFLGAELLLFGAVAETIFVTYTLWVIEVIAHEWYHIQDYTSWNVFNTKWRGIDAFMRLLSRAGVVDKHAHHLHHQVDLVEQLLTKHFADVHWFPFLRRDLEVIGAGVLAIQIKTNSETWALVYQHGVMLVLNFMRSAWVPGTPTTDGTRYLLIFSLLINWATLGMFPDS